MSDSISKTVGPRGPERTNEGVATGRSSFLLSHYVNCRPCETGQPLVSALCPTPPEAPVEKNAPNTASSALADDDNKEISPGRRDLARSPTGPFYRNCPSPGGNHPRMMGSPQGPTSFFPKMENHGARPGADTTSSVAGPAASGLNNHMAGYAAYANAAAKKYRAYKAGTSRESVVEAGRCEDIFLEENNDPVACSPKAGGKSRDPRTCGRCGLKWLVTLCVIGLIVGVSVGVVFCRCCGCCGGRKDDRNEPQHVMRNNNIPRIKAPRPPRNYGVVGAADRDACEAEQFDCSLYKMPVEDLVGENANVASSGASHHAYTIWGNAGDYISAAGLQKVWSVMGSANSYADRDCAAAMNNPFTNKAILTEEFITWYIHEHKKIRRPKADTEQIEVLENHSLHLEGAFAPPNDFSEMIAGAPPDEINISVQERHEFTGQRTALKEGWKFEFHESGAHLVHEIRKAREELAKLVRQKFWVTAAQLRKVPKEIREQQKVRILAEDLLDDFAELAATHPSHLGPLFPEATTSNAACLRAEGVSMVRWEYARWKLTREDRSAIEEQVQTQLEIKEHRRSPHVPNGVSVQIPLFLLRKGDWLQRAPQFHEKQLQALRDTSRTLSKEIEGLVYSQSGGGRGRASQITAPAAALEAAS